MAEEFTSVRPLAKELKVSPAALYQAIAKNKLPHYRLGAPPIKNAQRLSAGGYRGVGVAQRKTPYGNRFG